MRLVLPKHITPERMARVAVSALTRTPKLAQCDQASFFSSMLMASQIGLEPDGRLAHLVPYGTTCQLIVDWKGLAQLAYRSGQVSTLHSDVVYSGDTFNYNCGHITTHIPHFLRTDSGKPATKGNVIAAYSIAVMKDGARMAVAMSEEEVDSIRKRSKASGSGPWVTDINEMRKKTAFRRLSKWLPLESEKFREALEIDDETSEVNVTPASESAAKHFGPAAEDPTPSSFEPGPIVPVSEGGAQ